MGWGPAFNTWTFGSPLSKPQQARPTSRKVTEEWEQSPKSDKEIKNIHAYSPAELAKLFQKQNL
jgi:hypothetical protein